MITLTDTNVTVQNLDADNFGITVGSTQYQVPKDQIRQLSKQGFDELPFLLMQIMLRLISNNIDVTNLTAVKNSIEGSPFKL